jgi:hypothetical protein
LFRGEPPPGAADALPKGARPLRGGLLPKVASLPRGDALFRERRRVTGRGRPYPGCCLSSRRPAARFPGRKAARLPPAPLR